MQASEIENLVRKVFRVAFRLGEHRIDKRHQALTVNNSTRYATNTEIDSEGRYHIANLLEEARNPKPILLDNKVEPDGANVLKFNRVF